MATRLTERAADESRVLTNAVTRVADLWSLTNDQLGRILGLSPASASRLRAGRLALAPDSKAFEIAEYLVRLFRGLDALMGSDDGASKAWLRTRNLDLETAPLALLSTFTGLARVCDYVDAHRARV